MRTYFKNILRDIKKKKGKVFSIGIMVGLATMVIVALTLSGPSMRKSLNKSLDIFNHPDIIVKSTYPMDYEDKILLEKDGDIDQISFINTIDLFDKEKIIRLKSFDKNFSKVKIVEGNNISKDDEIILDKSLKDYYKIGDEIDLSYINDDQKEDNELKNTKYKLVGFFTTSEKIMEDMRDVSPLGKKEIDGLAFVNKENFLTEKFNEVNISYKDSYEMDKTSQAYIDFVGYKKSVIEDDIYHRPKNLLNEIKKEANEKISDAETDINEAEEKISSTEKDLADAKVKLHDGFRKYEEEKAKFNREIRNAEIRLANSLNDLESGQVELENAKRELASSWEEYNKEIPEAEKALDSNYQELTKAREEIDSKKRELQASLDAIEKAINDAKSLNTLDTLSDIDQEMESSDNTNPLDSQNTDNITELENQKQALLGALSEIEEKEKEVSAGLLDYEKARIEFDEKKSSALKELENGESQIDQNQIKINQGWAEYYQGRDRLNYNREDGKRKLEDAYNKLLSSKVDYEDGIEEFNENKGEAKEKIEGGKKEIADKKELLLKLRDPEYDVITIFDDEGIDTYYQNSLNMDSLSRVFPAFFYMVAMLVTLTTMQRYISEQRLINGTLKSLGYTNQMIARRFYIYGLIPTILGSIIGGILGRALIVKVIFNAYSTGFDIIESSYINSLSVIVGSIILSSVLVGLTVYFSSKETVRESPARLLQAKAPEIGSKILIEKIKPIWKRLSFMQKITARNTFRYKSRMFMTIFGVAGCTALIFFGFAMIDSLKDTANIQQKEIHNYKVVAMLDEKASDEEYKKYNNKISPYNHLAIRSESASLIKNDKDLDISVVIPEDNKEFEKFVNLRKDKKNPIDLEKAGAVITENASNILNIKENDKIKVRVDGKDIEVKVGAIAENYVADYLYLSNKSYEDLAKDKVSLNANYIDGDPKDIIYDLEDEDLVMAVINTSKAYASMDSLLNNLYLVIVVITLISSILASVVLYNITDINVSERKRELATIKVLGFYAKEVASYIYREIFFLTLIGIIGGFVLGYLMFRFILRVVAPRDIMLAYKLHPLSFIVSAGITLLLSLIMLAYIHKKLKKIDMAEAMSSGE